MICNFRIDARFRYFSQHGYALGGGIIHEDRHMRSADESAILQPLRNQRLSFFLRETIDVNVIDQRQVNIARIADSHFARQLRNVVHAHLNQVAGT